jgi:RNA polymerase sigma factor (sigma-70 family)
MATHTDDLAFVEKVANGDREAAELFLYRCQLWTGQLARMSGLPKQEWCDVANEALLTALGQMRRGLFRGDSSFQTWVERIIRGKIADYWRASENSQAELIRLDSGLDEYQQEVERNVSLIQSLTLRKTDEETRLMVRQALHGMSRQHAMVLLLNVREGYSTVEISGRLDLPQGTVGRKLYEAKKQFRQFFGEKLIPNPQSEATQAQTSDEPPQRTPETILSRKATLLWRISIPHWPNLNSVPRRNFTMPSLISVLATLMKLSGAWSRSI